MLLNSHISAKTRCLAEKVCGLVRSTWGTAQGEDKLGARDKILNTKVARRACTGQTFPLRVCVYVCVCMCVCVCVYVCVCVCVIHTHTAVIQL